MLYFFLEFSYMNNSVSKSSSIVDLCDCCIPSVRNKDSIIDRVLLLSVFTIDQKICLCALFKNESTRHYEIFDNKYMTNKLLGEYVNNMNITEIINHYLRDDYKYNNIAYIMTMLYDIVKTKNHDFYGEVAMYNNEFLNEFKKYFKIIRGSGQYYFYKIRSD